jgi:hypothetical protein
MAWARCLKSAVLDEADMSKPQGERVVKEIKRGEQFGVELSATQFFYWWKGTQSPSVTALKILENKGFAHNSLFDENFLDSYANRHFSILDTWGSLKKSQGFKSSMQSVHLTLSKLDDDWSPCYGRLGTVGRYQFDEDLLFTLFEGGRSDSSLAEHYMRLGWEKKGLHPGPRVSDEFNALYDPYNLSCLLVWLLSIAPIYTFDDIEYERLAVDLATATFCLRSIHTNLSGGKVTYRSSGLSGLIMALSSLFLDSDISPDTVIDILAYNETSWPLESINQDSGEMMISAVLRLRDAYHSWLSVNGTSITEVLKFL